MRNRSRPMSRREDDCTIRTGAAADAVYDLAEERALIRIGESNEIARAQHTGPAAFLSEIVLTNGGPRSAPVLAQADSILPKFPTTVQCGCLRGNATTEVRTMRDLPVALAARLRRANTGQPRS